MTMTIVLSIYSLISSIVCLCLIRRVIEQQESLDLFEDSQSCWREKVNTMRKEQTRTLRKLYKLVEILEPKETN